MQSQNWTCPYCDRPQTLTSSQTASVAGQFVLNQCKYGVVGISAVAKACANSDCRELSIVAHLTQGEMVDPPYGVRVYKPTKILESYPLRPQSTCKPQPEYIPAPLRDDYLEACAIRDLSPKASATLARRCLQGMIRDFCGISKRRLIDEVNALRTACNDGKAPPGVDLESIEAIDHVRQIGNIGAHMEADINNIIDVEPGEAQKLIELIELLFGDWYVARHKRQEKLASIKAIADGKQAEKDAFRLGTALTSKP